MTTRPHSNEVTASPGRVRRSPYLGHGRRQEHVRDPASRPTTRREDDPPAPRPTRGEALVLPGLAVAVASTSLLTTAPVRGLVVVTALAAADLASRRLWPRRRKSNK